MFDADYFRNGLARDVAALGGTPVVEVQLVNGHGHRVHSVAEIHERYVTLEIFAARAATGMRPRFGAAATGSQHADRARAVVSYDSIASVVLDPTLDPEQSRTGFGL